MKNAEYKSKLNEMQSMDKDFGSSIGAIQPTQNKRIDFLRNAIFNEGKTFGEAHIEWSKETKPAKSKEKVKVSKKGGKE